MEDIYICVQDINPYSVFLVHIYRSFIACFLGRGTVYRGTRLKKTITYTTPNLSNIPAILHCLEMHKIFYLFNRDYPTFRKDGNHPSLSDHLLI